MRAGGFAEDRVIDLINRRFVPFFYNRSGHGEGDDAKASAFVTGKTENPYAFFAAFDENGNTLGETDLYADKNAIFDWLRDLLVKHPERAWHTEAEQATLERANDAPTDCEARLAAAKLHEELGDYADATRNYEFVIDHGEPSDAARARVALLRITRYARDWDRHAKHEAALRELAAAHALAEHLHDADAERGHRLVAQKDFAAARSLLQPASRRASASQRLAEIHFAAGLACWFLDDREWAKLHWCWIVENLPEDRLERRAYIAAAAEAMPYVNPELDGYKAPVGNIGTHSIVTGYARAKRIHDDLLEHYEAERYTAGRQRDGGLRGLVDVQPKDAGGDATSPTEEEPQEAEPPAEHGSPTLLVASLRDGNEHVPANNKAVDGLRAIGSTAVPSLLAAIDDRAFPGRGYAAWGLALVLKDMQEPDAAALARLRKVARDDEDAYVRLLANSGLSRLD